MISWPRLPRASQCQELESHILCFVHSGSCGTKHLQWIVLTLKITNDYCSATVSHWTERWTSRNFVRFWPPTSLTYRQRKGTGGTMAHYTPRVPLGSLLIFLSGDVPPVKDHLVIIMGVGTPSCREPLNLGILEPWEPWEPWDLGAWEPGT